MPRQLPEPYLERRQRSVPQPAAWHEAVADAIEAAFASGVTDLDDLVAAVNAAGAFGSSGGPWDATTLIEELDRADRSGQ